MKKLPFGGLVAMVLLLAPATLAQTIPECIDVPGVPDSATGFVHRIVVESNGEQWYLLGAELELMGIQNGQPQDVPGHCWKKSARLGGRDKLTGLHWNTGPIGAGAPPRFWSSDAGDHTLLYWVDAIIDKWTPKIASEMFEKGYVHYHELVRAGDGCLHPNLVIWLRHHSQLEFSFDGGPPRFKPDGTPFRPRNFGHQVHPGIDYNFPPNYDMPYAPEEACAHDGGGGSKFDSVISDEPTGDIEPNRIISRPSTNDGGLFGSR